jgi:hypothetical protein
MKHFHFREESGGYLDYECCAGSLTVWLTYEKHTGKFYALIKLLVDTKWEIIAELPMTHEKFIELAGDHPSLPLVRGALVMERVRP